MVQIKNITTLSNVSRKQINNRLKPLKKKYPHLINGGGKGRGGRYNISPLLIKYLTQPNTEIKITESQIKDMLDKQDNYLRSLPTFDTIDTFKMVDWDWFCCFHPVKKITDVQVLIDCIPMNEGDLFYYSIHTKDVYRRITEYHIHFVLKSEVSRKVILKSTPFISDDNVVPFDFNKIEGCYNYFSNDKLIRSDNQKLSEWGYIMKIKNEKVHIWGRR